MTEMGRRVGTGDMLKSVYDSNEDGVIAVAQTEADMEKADYDSVINALIALAAAHKTQHQSAGADALNVTGLTGTTPLAILGDALAVQKLRMLVFYISDGTTGPTIKCKALSLFQGDAIAEVDNITKGTPSGVFSLDAAGEKLTIDVSAFSGSIKLALLHTYRNTSTNPMLIFSQKSAGSLILHFYDHATGANVDITGQIATGEIRAFLLYITDA